MINNNCINKTIIRRKSPFFNMKDTLIPFFKLSIKNYDFNTKCDFLT